MSSSSRSFLGPYLAILASVGTERKNLVGLVLLLSFGAALEAAGVAASLPFVALIQDPNALDGNVLGQVLLQLGAGSLVEKVAIVGGGLAALFVFKSAYAVWVNALQIRFSYSRMVLLARALLRDYLNRPYTFHLDTNSAELARSVISDSTLVFLAAIPSTFVLLVESMTLVVVAAVLVALEPVAIPIACVLIFALVLVVQKTVISKLATLGASARDREGSMLMWVNQALGGIKEIQVRGTQEYFVSRFSMDLEGYTGSLASYRTAAVVPRAVLEAVGVVGLVVVSLLLLLRHGDPRTVIPTLGALAVAVARVLPAVARIVGALTDLRYYQTAAQSLLQRSAEVPLLATSTVGAQPREAAPPQEPLMTRSLTFRGVSYRYPGARTDVLRDIDLTIASGETVALVGSSGAGKTTMADLAVGLLIPAGGRIEVDGKALDAELLGHWRKAVSYIPQNVFLCDDTIRRNIAFGIHDEEIDDGRIATALKQASLSDLVASLPSGLDTVVGEGGARLSGGQRQRIGIARALYLEPRFLVLDEATSALDGVTERDVAQAIEALRGQRAMMIIAHRLSSVRSCDRIVLMERGRIVDVGPWEELMTRSAAFRALVDAANGKAEGAVPVFA